MIAVDTNILVYALRESAERHAMAKGALMDLAQGQARWALPEIVIGEFLSIATAAHAPVSLPVSEAMDWMDALVASPSVTVVSGGPRHWSVLRAVIGASKVRGARVHDARIVAVCFEHGIDTILTEDKDMRVFDEITALPLADFGTARERAPRYRATRKRTVAPARG